MKREICSCPVRAEAGYSNVAAEQVASILTCVVTASAALFSYHCAQGRLQAAAVHPPVMFFLLAVLLIVPIDAVYKVYADPPSLRESDRVVTRHLAMALVCIVWSIVWVATTSYHKGL